MIPGVYLPLRSVLVTTPTGNILISPIEFTGEQLENIQSQGDVIAIVAPSALHNLWVVQAKNRFRKAAVWGVPGLKAHNPAVPCDKLLTRDAWPFIADLIPQPLAAIDDLDEVVFLHPESKSLIVMDLVFNIKKPQGLLAPIVYRVFDSYKKLSVSKMFARKIKDRAAFRASIEKVLAFDFDRLVMAHGDIVATNGKAKLREALSHRGLL